MAFRQRREWTASAQGSRLSQLGIETRLETASAYRRRAQRCRSGEPSQNLKNILMRSPKPETRKRLTPSRDAWLVHAVTNGGTELRASKILAHVTQ